MAQRGATLDELFDRPYRPGTAFGQRVSPLRRWGMLTALFLLVGVIITYWYLTDARRVRAMAEKYLAELTGGHVQVKSARLSIFEGLRLDGVSVHAEKTLGPDSLIFRAQTFLIRYNPQSILSGKLEATQIIALDPQVYLVEDVDKGRWNFQRMPREDRVPTRTPGAMTIKLPEILLRNAQVYYSRIARGKLLNDRGLLEIEGSFKPGIEANEIAFTAQSRDHEQSLGPVLKGTFNFETHEVSASLENFRFGRHIEVMLPEQVRTWCKEHGLSGGIDIPEFYVKPGTETEKPRFRVVADFRNVMFDIMPEEWLSREEGRRLAAMRRTVSFMKDAGLDTAGFATQMDDLFNPSMIELDKVAGRFVFTDEGIEIDNISGWLEKNPFKIKGKIEGYSALSAASITVEGDSVTIPRRPRYVNSMPPAFRELYDHLKPEGDGALWLKIERKSSGDKPVVMGRIDIHDGRFQFDQFAYPLRKVNGRITFGWDEKTQMDRVDVLLRGMGIEDGPNKDVPVTVRGFVGPLGQGLGEIDFTVEARGVRNEPELTAAYPKEAQEALKLFDAPGKGEFPQYLGSFVANVRTKFGPQHKVDINVDMTLDRAKGQLTFFPYPVDDLSGRLRITDQGVDIIGATVKKGDARFVIDGVVRYGKDKPVEPLLKVTGRNLPIDKDLLAALSKDRREWLEKIGLKGKLDIDGRIERVQGSGFRVQKSANPEDDITYDLQLKLKEGSVWPVDGVFAMTDISVAMRLTPEQLMVTEMKGRRGDAQITGSGLVTWPGGKPKVVINASAKTLTLDQALYKLIPAEWREGWDQARPSGTVDMELSYSGEVAKEPVASIGTDAAPPQAGGFTATIRPVKLSASPKIFPAKFSDLKGEILIRPDAITLKDITGKRGDGTMSLSGTIAPGKQGKWELKASGKDLVPDKELMAALPPAVSKLLEALANKGNITVDFSRLTYTPAADPKEDGQLDFAATITLAGNSLEVGVPLSDVHGTIALEAVAKNGKLMGLKGTIDLPSLKLSGREVKNFKADLIKPPSDDALRIGKITGEIAGGALAGQIDLVFPDNGASRFGMGLVMRNADVKELMGDTDQDVKGQITASLAIEGNWGEPGTRRGRGDVQVSGKEMYKIPLMLGLMQITNLSLPISSPFNEAAARYSVEGERVTFEQIELRASNMLMQGNGWLDFGTKKVRMTFTTDNPNAWKIPFLHELLQGARQEFMQIQVSGTVQEPKVGGKMMNTFSTTIDEVFKGDKAPKRKGK